MLSAPGQLVRDFLTGRSKRILDPLQYFITCTFIELLVVSFVHVAAPALDRMSALNWLGRLSSVVAVKILVVLGMGTLWRVLFQPVRYTLGEIYAVTIYALGTINVLWLLLPLADLIVPIALGDKTIVVVTSMLMLQSIYLTYVVRQFAATSIWSAAWRVNLALAITYLLPRFLFGVEQSVHFVIAPLSE
jgi:Protein of unknown function (DUF3667)